MMFPSLDKLKLPDSKKDERVIVIVWHHWWIFLREVLGLVLLFIGPFIMIPFVLSLFATQSIQVGGAPVNLVLFFSSFWALVIWNVLFTRWTDFYFDVWIITNWRIIDVDQRGLFKRNISSILNLNHIQDIQTEIEGIIKTFLDFGSIEVQTAGTKREFIFNDVAHPRQVEQTIRDAQAEQLRINKAGSDITDIS